MNYANQYIVIINGAAQTGKDTFVKYIYESRRCVTHNHSTVDTPKRAARVFGVSSSGKLTDPARRFIHALKMAWVDFNDGPSKELALEVTRVGGIYEGRNLVFFVHCRESEEIKKIVNAYGSGVCRTVLLINPTAASVRCDADERVNEYKEYDFKVHNPTGDLDHLKKCAMTFLDHLFGPGCRRDRIVFRKKNETADIGLSIGRERFAGDIKVTNVFINDGDIIAPPAEET